MTKPPNQKFILNFTPTGLIPTKKMTPHVPIEPEDNIYFDLERNRLALNRELVERVLVVANALGREPYSRTEARKILCGK